VRTRSVAVMLCAVFALGFVVSVVTAPKPATAELWPHCNCWYYCPGNPPHDPKYPNDTTPNTLGQIPYLGELCEQAPACQECPPLP